MEDIYSTIIGADSQIPGQAAGQGSSRQCRLVDSDGDMMRQAMAAAWLAGRERGMRPSPSFSWEARAWDDRQERDPARQWAWESTKLFEFGRLGRRREAVQLPIL